MTADVSGVHRDGDTLYKRLEGDRSTERRTTRPKNVWNDKKQECGNVCDMDNFAIGIIDLSQVIPCSTRTQTLTRHPMFPQERIRSVCRLVSGTDRRCTFLARLHWR